MSLFIEDIKQKKIKISIALIKNSVDKWTGKSQMKKNG